MLHFSKAKRWTSKLLPKLNFLTKVETKAFTIGLNKRLFNTSNPTGFNYSIDPLKVNDPKVRAYINKNNRQIKEFELIHNKTIELFPGESEMVTDLSQLYLFKFLMPLLNVKYAIEVGTFTGSSSIAIAKALPNDGKLICIDPSQQYADIAKEYWKSANVLDKIDFRLRSGVSELEILCNESSNLNKFDFIFLDALKSEYIKYYELSLKLIKPKTGVVCFDNTLWSLKVVDTSINDKTTVVVREFNEYVEKDTRVDMVLTDVGDGTTFVRKLE